MEFLGDSAETVHIQKIFTFWKLRTGNYGEIAVFSAVTCN